MSSPCQSNPYCPTTSTSCHFSSSGASSPDDEQPCCSRSLFPTVSPTSPAASTAANTTATVKRKIEEVDAANESGAPPRKCSRKMKHLTPCSSPASSPRSESPESDIDMVDTTVESEADIEKAIKNFDIYKCLSSLFGCEVKDPEEEAVKQFDIYACLSGLFGYTVRPTLKNIRSKYSRSIPKRKCRPSASCSRKIHDTGAFPTSNYMYQKWNTCFLQKLQKEIYEAQQKLSETILSRIPAIPNLPKPLCKPTIYTTLKKRMDRKLDWDKLQASLSYLSTEEGQTIGKERAKQAVQTISLLCRRRQERVKLFTIGSAKLTRWCAAALMAQGIRVTPELSSLPTMHLLGHHRFISGKRDMASAHSNLTTFLDSCYALSLLCRGEPIQNTSPTASPAASSDDSEDNEEDIA